jgi:hypothetical protein
MEISHFGKPFLAQMKALPLFADGSSKNDAVIR